MEGGREGWMDGARTLIEAHSKSSCKSAKTQPPSHEASSGQPARHTKELAQTVVDAGPRYLGGMMITREDASDRDDFGTFGPKVTGPRIAQPHGNGL